MGHNSASANCLQVSFNIWCVVVPMQFLNILSLALTRHKAVKHLKTANNWFRVEKICHFVAGTAWIICLHQTSHGGIGCKDQTGNSRVGREQIVGKVYGWVEELESQTRIWKQQMSTEGKWKQSLIWWYSINLNEEHIFLCRWDKHYKLWIMCKIMMRPFFVLIEWYFIKSACKLVVCVMLKQIGEW